MRQPRQRPVSCKLCRSRKLRCDRHFPCSNCNARGVPCELGDSVPPAARPYPHRASNCSSTAGHGSPTTRDGLELDHNDDGSPSAVPSGTGTHDLQSRLERLEKVVQLQSQELERIRNAVFRGEGQVNKTSVASSSPAAASERSQGQTQNHDSPVPAHLQTFTVDAMKLEALCSAKDLTENVIADEIIFQTCPMRSIPKQGAFLAQVNPHTMGQGPHFVAAQRVIYLPLRHEARYITQRYFLEVTYFHHIIHSPTLATRISTLYDALENPAPQQHLDKGTILLLLALCANVCFTWTPSEDLACSFMDSASANKQAANWMKATMDVLDHTQRIAFASMEAVQGIMVLFFVLFCAEGINRRGGDLMNRAVTMARELGLHHIDKPDVICPFRPKPKMSESEKEIGRRVMWYIAATDWSLGNFSMPQEGCYNVDARHLHVKRPRNINDEDISDTKPIIERPAHEETSASYNIHRIRLAELCRDLFDFQLNADLIYPPTPATTQYQQILEIDARLHRFLAELPPFFNLDFSAPPENEDHHGPFAGQVLRRCTIHLLVSRHLCKLHLPYLARGAIDKDFVYSRRICLESARTIIRTEKKLSKETLPAMSLRTRMTMVLRSVFLASVALVLDACTEGDDELDSVRWPKTSAEEIVEAWMVMEQAKSVSPTASRLLELSKLVLRKQNPSHPALVVFERETDAPLHSTQASQTLSLDQTAQLPLPQLPNTDISNSMSPPMAMLPPAQDHADLGFWNAQWMDLEQNTHMEGIDWDKLFWQVHPPFL